MCDDADDALPQVASSCRGPMQLWQAMQRHCRLLNFPTPCASSAPGSCVHELALLPRLLGPQAGRGQLREASLLCSLHQLLASLITLMLACRALSMAGWSPEGAILSGCSAGCGWSGMGG